MDPLHDIQAIWQSADVSALPDAGEAERTIRQFRRKQTARHWGVLALICLLAVATVYLILFHQSQLLTTRLGEACYAITLLILLTTVIRSMRRLSARQSADNRAFLAYIREEQQSMLRFQQRTQGIGFALACLGLVLFLYEWLQDHPGWMIPVYAGVLLYVLACWFLLRPVMIRRKKRQLGQVAEQLERLSRQLSGDDVTA